jgi:DNA-binding transcriptional LysR family regulator
MADDQGKWEDHYRTALPGLSPEKNVCLRNNVSSAHFSAILNGAGIGILPTYVQAFGANLVPLEGIAVHAYDIWLAYRTDAKRIARIRQIIEWLVHIYDPRRYPWFRDEFIHPGRFAEIYKGPPLKHAYADMLA